MRSGKLLTPTMAAMLLGAASLIFVANAYSDESVQTAGGVSYVSGGVGADSIDRINALARNFNLKLVFALKSGDYVNDVQVVIANAAGKTLLNATSEGPWFLSKLPAGNYQIVATYSGNSQKRSISIGTERLKSIDFRWASE